MAETCIAMNPHETFDVKVAKGFLALADVVDEVLEDPELTDDLPTMGALGPFVVEVEDG